MKILIAKPKNELCIKEINEITSEFIRKTVGNSPTLFGPMEDGCVIIYNKTQDTLAVPLTKLLRNTERNSNTIMFGKHIFCKISADGEDLIGLTDKEIQKYIKQFS